MHDEMVEYILSDARSKSLDVTKEQAGKLARYTAHLERWNRKMNLVGPAHWRDIHDTLIVDSMYLANFLARELPELGHVSPRTYDLGAGAGLPGIPLRILWDAGEYTLVEPREKRVGFMTSALGRLGLVRTDVVRDRAENLPQGEADIIISRAFMPWRELLPFVAPLMREQGLIIILSNDEPPSDMKLESASEKWSMVHSLHYSVGKLTRWFWVVSRRGELPGVPA